MISTAKPILEPSKACVTMMNMQTDLFIIISSIASIPVTVRLGIPTEGAGQRADGRDDQQSNKRGIPAVGLHELAQTHAGKGCAGVTEEASQADGAGGGAFGGEIGRRDADEALRAIDEEARAAKEQGVEPKRFARDLPKEQNRNAGHGHIEHAGAEAAPAE